MRLFWLLWGNCVFIYYLFFFILKVNFYLLHYYLFIYFSLFIKLDGCFEESLLITSINTEVCFLFDWRCVVCVWVYRRQRGVPQGRQCGGGSVYPPLFFTEFTPTFIIEREKKKQYCPFSYSYTCHFCFVCYLHLSFGAKEWRIQGVYVRMHCTLIFIV